MTDDLADRVRMGVDALRAGHPARAAAALEPVASDAAFLEAPDLADVRARVFSLLAQALLESGRPHEADRWARRALDATRDLGDEAGEAQVRDLHRRIFSAATTARRAREAAATVADTPLDQLLAGAKDAGERAAVLVEKASALLDMERVAEGGPIAKRALDTAIESRSLREEVLARILVARADPGSAAGQLEQAWRRAEAAGEANLVTAVARAAEVCGVTLPVQHGPDMGRT